MKAIASSKLLFVTSVIAGGTMWAAFAVFETEPWDSPYGWVTVAGLGLTFGFLEKGNPMFWPLDIFLGEVLFGLGNLLKSIFFYSGGGVNFFFPLGLIFLVPFAVPALVGSVVGFGIRKATNGA
jgi:hypothetical protein